MMNAHSIEPARSGQLACTLLLAVFFIFTFSVPQRRTVLLDTQPSSGVTADETRFSRLTIQELEIPADTAWIEDITVFVTTGGKWTSNNYNTIYLADSMGT